MVRTGITRIKVDDKVIMEEIFEGFFFCVVMMDASRSIGEREFHR